jgi:hypothetical protein
MTLGEAITMALDNTKLDTDNTTHKNRAREYLNIVAVKVANLQEWWWTKKVSTFKTTLQMTITGASGTFTVGETITGGTSSSTAVVDSHDTTNGYLYVYSESAAFTATETLTGGTSSVTATFGSSTKTRLYSPISAQVSAWYSFYDRTNGARLDIIDPDMADGYDSQRDETGSLSGVVIEGLDATTGYPVIQLYPADSTTNETVQVRYRQDIAAWTSSNDASQLTVLGIPRVLEHGLVEGATGLHRAEKGDVEGAKEAREGLATVVELMMGQNVMMQGNQRYLPSNGANDEFFLNIGTSLATQG